MEILLPLYFRLWVSVCACCSNVGTSYDRQLKRSLTKNKINKTVWHTGFRQDALFTCGATAH
jgi:hypothetical protein